MNFGNYIFINLLDQIDVVIDADTYDNALKEVLKEFVELPSHVHKLPEFVDWLNTRNEYYSFGGVLKSGKPVELKIDNATQKDIRSKPIKRYLTKYKKKCEKPFKVFLVTVVEKKVKKDKIVE